MFGKFYEYFSLTNCRQAMAKSNLKNRRSCSRAGERREGDEKDETLTPQQTQRNKLSLVVKSWSDGGDDNGPI